MSTLFTPFPLRGKILANRIVVSPMCQYSAIDGRALSWHQIHLGSLALSGAGLLFVEATSVNPAGRITPGDLGLYDDATQDALATVVRMVRANSNILLGIQLAHAGRKASSEAPWQGGALIGADAGGWPPLAPSALPHRHDEPAPVAMNLDDIETLKQDFAASAKRAVAIGFDVIELHFAHGYLIHQFLSPVANQRTDLYGGSLDNRCRLAVELFEAVRAAVPHEVPVGVRLSASDWLEHLETPSWRVEDSIHLSHALKARGCDWIDASSGGISPLQKIAVGPGYQVPFARRIRTEVGIPVFAVGMITDPRQAETILAEGSADCVALARAMLFDPRWPWRAAQALGGQIQGPRQYWRALPSGTGPIFGDVRIGQR